MRSNVDHLPAESLPVFLSFEVAQKTFTALLLFFFTLSHVWFVAKAEACCPVDFQYLFVTNVS
jgi:hypothetical protein